jgi:hypothetical protein
MTGTVEERELVVDGVPSSTGEWLGKERRWSMAMAIPPMGRIDFLS